MEPARSRRAGPVVAIAAIAAVVIAHGRTVSLPGAIAEGERHLRAALFEPAERSFREALAHDAQSAAAHLGLAQTLIARQDIDKAQSEAEVAVQLSPSTASGYLTLASTRDQSGDPAGAADALDRYLAATIRDDSAVRRLRATSYRALLRLAGSAPLRVIETETPGTVPFEIVQDKLIVKASVNGRIPVDVILDTGAEHLVLSERTAARAGLPRTPGSAAQMPVMALAERFEVGGVTVRRAPAIVRPGALRTVPNLAGDAFSPVALGLSVIIDYERRELTVARRLPYEPADVELPLHIYGLPVVAGSSDREALSFVVDTGAEATAVSPETLSRATVDPAARRIPMRLFGAWGTGQSGAYLLTPGIDLAFGAIRLLRYPVIIHRWPDVEAIHGFEMAGILGHNFLRRYRVTIDLSRRVVRLKRQLPERR